MISFLTSKAANEKIQSLESRVAELEADLTFKDEAIETLQTESKDKDATIAENANKVETLTEERDTAKAELATATAKVTELETKVEEAKKSAGEQAIEALAAIGQTQPLPIEGEQDGEKEAAKNLTGLAKAIALHKLKNQSK
jgi:uncharacterized coiled-coil protein SlyX